MREPEAKRKWCPFARLVSLDDNGQPGASWNRFNNMPEHGQFPNSASCIASNCMAWRCDPKGNGYCGLAGKE